MSAPTAGTNITGGRFTLDGVTAIATSGICAVTASMLTDAGATVTMLAGVGGRGQTAGGVALACNVADDGWVDTVAPTYVRIPFRISRA